jgi:hypothetical protein
MRMATVTATPPRSEAVRLTPRTIGGAVAALVAGVVGFLLSQSLIATRADPAAAIASWRWNAAARAEQATALFAGAQDAPTAARARALSVSALREQPLLVPALRAFGVSQAIAGEDAGAARTMAFAETLSRRDLPTELWLIEQRVARGDVPGALVHYDRALRTADTAPDLLLPVLVGASADPAVARSLARLLATRPLWWSDFTARLIQQNPSPEGTATIVAALKLDPQIAGERTLLSAAMIRLADTGRADLARRLLPVAGRTLLRNGGFEAIDGLAPFDWRLAQDGDLGAEIGARDDGRGNALFLDARSGRGGEVARQLLTLAPGRYRITGTIGDVAATGEAPALFMTCAGQARPLGRFRTGAAPATGARFAVDVSVPAGCRGQWLVIEATAPLDVSDRRPWLDDLAIASE